MQELARQSGLPDRNLTAWERGEREPGLASVLAVLGVLGPDLLPDSARLPRAILQPPGGGRTFGERLRAVRLAAGLTARQAAQQAGVRATLFYDYELGRSEPKWTNLIHLLCALGPAILPGEAARSAAAPSESASALAPRRALG